MGGKGRTGRTLIAVALLSFPAFPALPAHPALPAFPALKAQGIPFDQAIRDLGSPDVNVRLKAVQLLRDAAFPEAALPIAKLVTDPRDEVQLEAIAAELNIFLAEKIVTRKRVAGIVEVRNAIAAEAAFTAGPSVLGAQPVPLEVLAALRTAARDDNPRVGLEAIYAFGVFAVEPVGSVRRELLRTTGPEVALQIGAADPAMRYAAVRVMGRVFAHRAGDEEIESTVGDAVVAALNDSDRAVKGAAMDALGAMRYGRGVQALTDLFQYYGKGESAEAAFDALARIASAGSVPLFTAQLASRSSSLRGTAIEGLARVGDPATIADIQTAAGADRSDTIALAVAFANARLANGSLDRIVEAVTKSKLRNQARDYLVELAPGRSEAFRRHLMDPDARIRLEMVGVLDRAGDPAALPLVEPLASDKDPQVARAAERATARLRRALNRPAS
jgi:HEAT repeat protein